MLNRYNFNYLQHNNAVILRNIKVFFSFFYHSKAPLDLYRKLNLIIEQLLDFNYSKKINQFSGNLSNSGAEPCNQ